VEGQPVGSVITIRLATNYWGPQFPETFVGERFVVTAYKQDAPTRMMSTTSGAPVPLWWRNIPYEYALPLWQGRASLPLSKEKHPLGSLGSEHTDVESFKRDALALLALSSEQREVRLLQRLSRKYLFGERYGDTKEKLPAPLGKLRVKVMIASSSQQIVNLLLDHARKDPKESRYPVGTVLAQAGGSVTMKLLEQIERLPFEGDHREYVMSSLRHRLGVSTPQRNDEQADDEKPPTATELANARKLLTGNPTEDQFYQLFEMMTRHDPEPVAAYLARWIDPESKRSNGDTFVLSAQSGSNRGYILGSYFAWRCGKDRERHLQTLLAARDPFIRTAGAVYLCYENKELGMTKLREMAKLPGDAGAWAALNLARRGDKEAMVRALEVFTEAGDIRMTGEMHRHLQTRLLVLLSNSAHKSKIPPRRWRPRSWTPRRKAHARRSKQTFRVNFRLGGT
jgi:hypothetical protein